MTLSPSHTPLLTRIDTLSDDYKVVSAKDGTPMHVRHG